jgi:hypothetical protein
MRLPSSGFRSHSENLTLIGEIMKIIAQLGVTYWLTIVLLVGFLTACPNPEPPSPDSQAPTITSFTADPVSIAPGRTSTLRWTLGGGAATTVSINNGVGTVTGSSVQVQPETTTTYTLTATNSVGKAEATATVTINQTSFNGCGKVASYTMGSKINGELEAADCTLGSVGRFVDYYEFTLNQTDSVTFLTNGAGLAIYRKNGTGIGSYGSSVTLDLTAGTYVVGVNNSGAILYEFTATSTSVGFNGCSVLTPYTIGNSIMGSLNSSDCFVPGNVGRFIDYYSFTITETTRLNFSTNVGGLAIYRRNGDGIGSYGSSVSLNLTAGTYVVGVNNSGALDSYTFQITQ